MLLTEDTAQPWRNKNSKIVLTFMQEKNWGKKPLFLRFDFTFPLFEISVFQEKFHSCNMIWPEPQNVWSTAFILYTATLGLFAPLLVICLCYLLIVIKVVSLLYFLCVNLNLLYINLYASCFRMV